MCVAQTGKVTYIPMRKRGLSNGTSQSYETCETIAQNGGWCGRRDSGIDRWYGSVCSGGYGWDGSGSDNDDFAGNNGRSCTAKYNLFEVEMVRPDENPNGHNDASSDHSDDTSYYDTDHDEASTSTYSNSH